MQLTHQEGLLKVEHLGERTRINVLGPRCGSWVLIDVKSTELQKLATALRDGHGSEIKIPGGYYGQIVCVAVVGDSLHLLKKEHRGMWLGCLMDKEQAFSLAQELCPAEHDSALGELIA